MVARHEDLQTTGVVFSVSFRVFAIRSRIAFMPLPMSPPTPCIVAFALGRQVAEMRPFAVLAEGAALRFRGGAARRAVGAVLSSSRA